MKKYVLIAMALAIFVSVHPALAAVPNIINYQGSLTSGGEPVEDGSYTIEFRIYNSSGVEVWMESHEVNVSGGRFIVLLGSNGSPITESLFSNDEMYLGIKVGDNSEIDPRTRLVTSPYAFRVSTVDGAGGGVISGALVVDGELDLGGALHATGIVRFGDEVTGYEFPTSGGEGDQILSFDGDGQLFWTDPVSVDVGWFHNGTKVLLDVNTDSVGIGTATPTERLDVAGNIHASGTIASGNSILIDGVNDQITSTSGSIDFDDENLSTTGSIGVGGFSMSTGAAADYVLTSDATGIASWQAAANMGEWTKTGNAIYTNEKIGIARSGTTLHGIHDSTHISLGVSGTTGTFGMDYKYATVSGGYGGTASQDNATVGGGRLNKALGQSSTVAGGASNTANENWSTIVGGTYNYSGGQWSFVGGGKNDSAKSGYSVVTGGSGNLASGMFSTIGGGGFNTASGGSSVIAGGTNNLAAATYAVIPGGYADTIAAGANYSYLFGIASKLTQDSTFMVDMPHIHFGDEASGYEFPETDGSSGQMLQTDGAGQLNWTTLAAASGWVNSGSVVRLDDINDEVGIGTSTPSSKLDVVGDLKVSDKATIGSSHTNGGNYSFVAGLQSRTSTHYSTIGGGYADTVTGLYGTIAGGVKNRVANAYGTVAGGNQNKADGWGANIGGGVENSATGASSTIAGGAVNSATGDSSFVGGGYLNKSEAEFATISGGRYNVVRGSYGVIGGGGGDLPEDSNAVLGSGGTVGGGAMNIAGENWTDDYNTVAGGYNNQAFDDYGTIGGGFNNTTSAFAVGGLGTVAGGMNNSASDTSFVGGGNNNTAQLYSSTIAGGSNNSAKNMGSIGGGTLNIAYQGSTVGGGNNNHAYDTSFIGGGSGNFANARSVVSGGKQNSARGYWSIIGGGRWDTVSANGYYAVIPGGEYNKVGQSHSWAGGYGAEAANGGCFVWADSYLRNPYTNGRFTSTNNNQFLVRAGGGVGLGTNTPHTQLTVEGHITPGTDGTYDLGSSAWRWRNVWATNGTILTSDRRLKTNIEPLYYGLADVIRLRPISFQWKKKNDDAIYLGLIAQEVREIIPEVVIGSDDPDQPLGLRYDQLIPVLINAIKEQQQAIEEMKSTHAAEMSNMEHRLDDLTQVVEMALDQNTTKLAKK